METITQEPQLLTEVQLGKRNAMQAAFDKIEAVAGTGTDNHRRVEVAQQLLLDIRNDGSISRKDAYRMEQAVSKLVEYFELEAEVEVRKNEIIGILPDASLRLAANDRSFMPIIDEKYKVAL